MQFFFSCDISEMLFGNILAAELVIGFVHQVPHLVLKLASPVLSSSATSPPPSILVKWCSSFMSFDFCSDIYEILGISCVFSLYFLCCGLSQPSSMIALHTCLTAINLWLAFFWSEIFVFQFSLKEFHPHTISFLIIHWWMMRALTFSSGEGKHNELMKPHAYSVNTILLIFLSFLSGTHQVRKYPTQIALLVLLLGLLTWLMIQRKDGVQ
jgi:hypothetical protein